MSNRNRNYGSGGNGYGGGYGGGGYGGGGQRGSRMGNSGMSPWDASVCNFGNMGGNAVGMRGGGGGGGGSGGGMNAQAINLANNLLNNLFCNQNSPSVLDIPRGGNSAGHRNQRGQQQVRYRNGSGNRQNRRQGGFNNRGAPAGGAKSAQRQGSGDSRKQNTDRAKKLLAKMANNRKKDSASGEKKTERKVSVYAGVPNDMFYCHLCKKHMWDAISFENHVTGRTHLMMREGIEESYRLKANMIRQKAKIAEQLKAIELDRLKRMGKSKQRSQEDYCTMCDLRFHGNMAAHRRSEGHLDLKKFLHPTCSACNKEFATRIDFDTHLLSADHLKKASEKNTKVGECVLETLITVVTEEEELKDVRPPQKRKRKVSKKAESADGEAKTDAAEEAEGDETEVGRDAEKKEAEEKVDEGKEDDESQEDDITLPVDPENCILDYVEGDSIPMEIENLLPKYNFTRPVGVTLINKIECFECKLCRKFFDCEKTVEIHSRTLTHHRNFLKFINDKSSDTKIAQKRAAAAAAAEESDRKKRKLDDSDAAPAEDVEVKKEKEETKDADLYDPTEALIDEDALLAGSDDDDTPATDEMLLLDNNDEKVTVKTEDNDENNSTQATSSLNNSAQSEEFKSPSKLNSQESHPSASSLSGDDKVSPTATPNKKASRGRGTGRGRNRGRSRS